MTRGLVAVAALSFAVGLPISAQAASLTQVNRSDWTGGVNAPSYVQMYIYVPDKLAEKPPIMVSSHSCGSTASGQMGNIPKIKAAADANGFILILPDNPGQNCWDVGSSQALKHDGGSDTQAVVAMVKYALTKYKGDPARVYAMGGSSGAMMTQALMAVYPDVFRAGHARAGVPAGCWADGYASSNQWSNNCAGGNTTKTAQQWGDLVRAMYSGYTGHRPRLQIMQGEADPTISYKNTAESIKEWTNVLGLSTTPTSMDTGYKAANASYDRQFWKNSCGYVVFEAWSSPGGTHSMPYEEAEVLKFFGLDTATGGDPEPDCSGSGGGTNSGGASGGGAGGAGTGVGSGGTNSSGSANGGGAGRGDTGKGGGSSAMGGMSSGGSQNSGQGGMTSGTASGGASSGGASSGGLNGAGGSATASGGANGSSGATHAASGGAMSEGGSGNASNGCTIGTGSSRQGSAATLAVGLALLLGARKRRRRQG